MTFLTFRVASSQTTMADWSVLLPQRRSTLPSLSQPSTLDGALPSLGFRADRNPGYVQHGLGLAVAC